jgi:hypothetical protein
MPIATERNALIARVTFRARVIGRTVRRLLAPSKLLLRRTRATVSAMYPRAP